jgi:hypothetical protein
MYASQRYLVQKLYGGTSNENDTESFPPIELSIAQFDQEKLD